MQKIKMTSQVINKLYSSICKINICSFGYQIKILYFFKTYFLRLKSKFQIIDLLYQMNSHYQTVLDIKARQNQNNPFIFRIPANSTSQEHINLSIAAHMLKKLTLIDIAHSKQLTELYKQSLLEVIQNPLLELKSPQVIHQVLYFLEYWHKTLGRTASWLHTRTCFYYLEDKLKKNHFVENLDLVRLKRAHLQPNKKQFLSKIMAENVQSEQLKQYIAELKQQSESGSQNGDIKQRFQPIQSIEQNNVSQLQNPQDLQISTNILYFDIKQDWKKMSKAIELMKQQEKKLRPDERNIMKQKIKQILDTYLCQKIPVLLNCMRSKKFKKQTVLQQLSFRKVVIEKLGVVQLTESLNVTISKIFYNNIF